MIFELIDSRFSASHFIANTLIFSASGEGTEVITAKAHALSSALNKDRELSQQELSIEVVNCLREIVILIERMTPRQKLNLTASAWGFAETTPEIVIAQIINSWETFTELKRRLAELAELSLVFPPPSKEFNFKRNDFRAVCKELMNKSEVSLADLQHALSLSDELVPLLTSNAHEFPALIEEYETLQDSLYCEALVALS